MEKIIALLKKLGIELTADQTKQLEEVGAKELVSAADAAKTATELEELKKQLAQRDADLEKLKSDTTSADLKKQLDELQGKYDADTKELQDKLSAQESDFAAERLFGNFNFASDRIRQSVLQEFKSKGFKFENGEFIGGKEFLEELKKSEPDSFAKEKPGLFMGSTQSTVSPEQNNIQTMVSDIFNNR